MPDPNAKDPHTLIFDKAGILWFTVQNANMIGRLDPKSGEIKLLTPPTAKSRPYGMAFDPKGNLFVVQFGTNRIARVDTKTLEIREYTLPDEKSRPRRLTTTGDGMVWYADYSRGYLGRLDPVSGQVKEWQSPSGPRSAPYGISAIKNVIWYSESEASPNTVVRFDPKTEKFQSWPIPGGGNIVRNTDVTRDGGFVLANSLTNEVTLVRVAK
jgi:virginiamycin B lyase